jgi:capsular exopolysaccharide synthesis family protein
MALPENASPEPDNSGPSTNGAGPNRGSLVAVGGAYPLSVESDGFEAGTSRPTGVTQPAGVAGLLKALRQRWLLASIVGLICGSVAGAAMWFLKPAQYTAYALVRVASSGQRLLGESKENDVGQTTYQKTQAAMITSRNVLKAALREEKVRQLGLVGREADQIYWLEKNLKVGFIEETEILRIALSGLAPKDLAVLVNAVQESYLANVFELEHKQQAAFRDDLDKIVLLAQEKLRGQRQAFKALADAQSIADPHALTAKQRITLDAYVALSQGSGRIQSEIDLAKLKLLAQHRLKSLELPVPESLVDQQLDAVSEIQLLKRKVAEAQERFNIIEQATTPDSPARTRPRQELQAAQENLEKLRRERRDEVVKRLRQKIRDENERLAAQIEVDIKILEGQKDAVDGQVKRVSAEAERIGTTSLELEMKKADIEQAEGVVKQLLNQKERLSAELQSTSLRRVTLLQSAELPETANIREHVQETVLVGLCAMALGVFGVGYREFRARWINTPDEVEQELGMRVVGTLPALSNRLGRRDADLRGQRNEVPLGLLVESIDSIRAMLSYNESAASMRIIMITSACPREGKTLLAGQLATSFARAGQRTLLIDGDLRKPCLHRLFGVPQSPGICEVLRGELDASLAINQTEVPELFLLPAGELSPSVLTTCLQEFGQSLFEHLRAEYKFVVVDSCPILPVADSLLLGQYVDAAVFAVRPRVSRSATICAAYERLRAVQIRVLGSVVNGVPMHQYGAYYHQYLPQDKS